MISLRLDPQGVNIFSGGQRNTTTASINQSSIDILETGHKMQELSSRVKELESELEKHQVSTVFNTKKLLWINQKQTKGSQSANRHKNFVLQIGRTVGYTAL